MLGIFGKQCQSCGMPLKKDPMGGGAMPTVLKVMYIVAIAIKMVSLFKIFRFLKWQNLSKKR